MSLIWEPEDDRKAREWMHDENVRQTARRLRIADKLGRLDRSSKIARGKYEYPPPRIARAVKPWVEALFVLALIMGALQIG